MSEECRHPSFGEFLALAARPDTDAKSFLTFVIEQTVKVSRSQVGMLVIHPMPDQIGEGTHADWVCAPRVSSFEGVWEISGHHITRAHEAMSECLDNTETNKAVYLFTVPSLLESQAALRAIRESPSSLWFQVSDGKKLLGCLSLGADECSAYSQLEVLSIKSLLSGAMLALSRLLLREHASKQRLEVNLVGRSEKFLEFERKLKQAASHSRCPVLIQGERGCGKELAAYAIHYYSSRAYKPLIPVLGSALAESLQADELFGHERNAFTGAVKPRKGKFLAAEGGTIFLDEIGDLPPSLQVSLLRVIERGEIQPIGRDFPIKVDIRVVMATNKDLRRLVDEGSFREDLYDRLNVINLQVPPLRHRREDIPLLVEYFLLKQCLETNKGLTMKQNCLCHRGGGVRKALCASEDIYRAAEEYDWPGNVRELENLITRLATMSPDEVLDARHLPEQLVKTSTGSDGITVSDYEDLSLERIVKSHIEKVLELSGNSQSQAAKILGIPRTTLQAKMRRLGLMNVTKLQKHEEKDNDKEDLQESHLSFRKMISG